MSYPVNKNYTTANGDYYVGMTKKEAEDKGIYKKTIGIDFHDIDLDQNGVLSRLEIDRACEKQKTRNMFGGLVECIVGTGLIAIGGIIALPSFFSSTPVLTAGAGMAVDGATRMLEADTPEGQTGLRGFIKQTVKKLVSQDK